MPRWTLLRPRPPQVRAPWRALQSLTPDATQLADPDWCPEIVRRAGGCPTGGGDGGTGPSSGGAVEASGPGSASASGPGQGKGPDPLPPSVAEAVLAARHGAIVPLTVMTVDVLAMTNDHTNRTPVTSKDDPVVCIGCDVRTYGTTCDGASRRSPAAGGKVVFMVAGQGACL
ncbi:hypothetical protein TSOC_009917 [Tetrabaena socialis]|uniref:Uncharacterized protein n=1 Tax=Tetrabaena socialis TaxID=47790 RepID=A0A2J7ZUN5_9CHLO|nr:hypothetical protein TSOC_009917 [Tetrabaena socialis]|eukprot:PNH03972.1 hypothetical protein TSOC_009917 [Tetrabaena socialis]